MRLSLRMQRLRLVWFLVVPYFLLARPSAWTLLAGLLLALPALALRGYAAAHIHKDRSLAVAGPYAHLRHPLYLGSFLLGLAFAVAGGCWYFPLLFLALFSWTYGRTIRAEERELEARFGGAYLRYRERVPSFLPRRWLPLSGDGDGRDPGSGGGSPPETGDVTGARGQPSPDSPADPPPGLPLYLRNKEWEAALGTGIGLALLWLRTVLG